MRSLLIVLVLAAPMARADAPSDPPKLKKLREDFARQRLADEKRWRDDYSNALKDLQDEYTKAANLDAALAVRSEIQNLTGETGTPPKPLQESLAGASFSWEKENPHPREKTLVFGKDGFVIQPLWQEVGKVSWIVVDNHTVVLRFSEVKPSKARGNEVAVLVFDADAKSFQGWGYHNYQVSGKRQR